MTKLEQLIQELCPNGVEYKKLNTICGIYDGVSLYLRYIISDDLKGHTHHLSRYLSSKNVAASSATWTIHASGYCSYASLTSRTVPMFPSEKPI